MSRFEILASQARRCCAFSLASRRKGARGKRSCQSSNRRCYLPVDILPTLKMRQALLFPGPVTENQTALSTPSLVCGHCIQYPLAVPVSVASNLVQAGDTTSFDVLEHASCAICRPCRFRCARTNVSSGWLPHLPAELSTTNL